MRFDQYPYGSIASVYDGLAAVYSRGRISQSKRFQIDAIRAGERILYAGVGSGEDALAAHRRGARVTAVDLSPRMLNRLSARLGDDALEMDLVHADVAAYDPKEPFDVVVANYFLNLFEVDRAREMLGHLAGLLRPGGSIWITDFARPDGGLMGRFLSEAYYRPANWIAWAVGFCALHPILDYAPMLEGLGLEIRNVRRLPVLVGRNPAFVSIEARRPARGEADPSLGS